MVGTGGSACSPLGDGDGGSGGTELLVGALGRPPLSTVTNGTAGPFPDPTVSMATASSVPQPPCGDPRLEAAVGPGPGGAPGPLHGHPPAPAPLPAGARPVGGGEGRPCLVSQAPLTNCSWSSK